MQCVAIVGVGLIGASFGLALRKAGFSGDILGISSSSSISAALKVGAISAACELTKSLEVADLIYLAQPIEAILGTLEAIGPDIREHSLVTDAGSTKHQIVETAIQYLPAGAFLGGHPIAGKEQRGAEHADASLFAGRPYVLTPSGEATGEQSTFKVWLHRIGAAVVEMDPQQHDATVALTSHLPQLLSTALAAMLEREDNPFVDSVFGSGLVDMTRLALSSADIWKSILSTNAAEIRTALRAYRRMLEAVDESLTDETIKQQFEAGKRFSERIRSRT